MIRLIPVVWNASSPASRARIPKGTPMRKGVMRIGQPSRIARAAAARGSVAVIAVIARH
jgi:hypothetical protein